MLAALDNGVKGGVWFTLMDKIHARANLEAAWRKVRSNKGSAGVDHVTVRQFAAHEPEELSRLQERLIAGRYTPSPGLRIQIPKGDGKTRPLGIPTVRDRVVQTAVRNVIEPIFEREFAEHSYGFRPGRSAHQALQRVTDWLDEGYRYVVDADIKSYFDTIPKDALMALVRGRIADGRVLSLIRSFLDQQVMEDATLWTPVSGTPQGAVLSPLLANIYLNPLDHRMSVSGYRMVRYADDFVVLCKTREEADAALAEICKFMDGAELTLHPDKTRIASLEAGEEFEFLGYRFKLHRRRILRFPRSKSEKKLREAVRNHTRRANGHSLECIIAKINPILRGWFGYFKHSYKTAFPAIDGWVRMRLRSILRKRAKRKGRGRGNDHQRWPNKYFGDLGLFSLTAAHGQLCESPMG
jgi:RNA-directed DNA polymerase